MSEHRRINHQHQFYILQLLGWTDYTEDAERYHKHAMGRALNERQNNLLTLLGLDTRNLD